MESIDNSITTPASAAVVQSQKTQKKKNRKTDTTIKDNLKNSMTNINNLINESPIITTLKNAVRNQSILRLDYKELKADQNIRMEDVDITDSNFVSLKNSIEKNGLIQNLVAEFIRIDNQNFKLILRSGHRRLRAIQLLAEEGKPQGKVPVKIVEKNSINVSIEENVLRKGMHFVEEANVYLELKQNNNWKDSDLIKYLDTNQKKVTRYLALAKLPTDIKETIFSNKNLFNSSFVFSKCIDIKRTHEEIRKILGDRINPPANKKSPKEIRADKLQMYFKKQKLNTEQEELVNKAFRYFKLI